MAIYSRLPFENCEKTCESNSLWDSPVLMVRLEHEVCVVAAAKAACLGVATVTCVMDNGSIDHNATLRRNTVTAGAEKLPTGRRGIVLRDLWQRERHPWCKHNPGTTGAEVSDSSLSWRIWMRTPSEQAVVLSVYCWKSCFRTHPLSSCSRRLR